ncbi:MAG: sulfatase-like hydrolase/transferase [Clostridia bacterium]|nr:sulfatase-like hydrolase/transferase [Clostridia bacterium]
MEKVSFDKSKKILPLTVFVLGAALLAAMFITRLNFTAVVCVAFCCVVSLLIFLGVIIKKRVYLWTVLGYLAALSGIMLYYIIFGADAGFGAFISGLAGFSSADNPLFCGSGNILTRLAGNIVLALPSLLVVLALYLVTAKASMKHTAKKIITGVLSLMLMLTSVLYVLTMNLRSKPNTVRLWQGQDEYLDKIKDSAGEDAPNVLFILMDDLGWGDISLNGSIYDTPNIDSIGENGIQFDNFYSSYSVCSPARFAALTGRYPYRGYADNVIYPTTDATSVFCSTRIFNSVQTGANIDGMLGDEITLAEALGSAGYATGAFGKWHLGDYGEYLPTNQGFDYFYGAYGVNDMTPLFHAKEQNGEYTIVHGTDELKDQSKATEWIHGEISQWLTDTVKSGKKFFAYYATPWPHAPVYVGDKYKGATGMGDYADCVTEFDAYLGELFDTLDRLGALDNTLIIFTSDNGPALQGSTGGLRGGKYLAYEGGQKVPCLMRWDKNPDFKAGTVREQSATLVDVFPTVLELCGINGLPEDRITDGISITPVIKKDIPVHGSDTPIIYMKREDVKAIQYTVPVSQLKEKETELKKEYDILKNNKYISFKYFDRIQNDNSAFFDKFRKNWLHILNDDEGESYNRSGVYPNIAKEMSERLKAVQNGFADNRRGVK